VIPTGCHPDDHLNTKATQSFKNFDGRQAFVSNITTVRRKSISVRGAATYFSELKSSRERRVHQQHQGKKQVSLEGP
jgi:hypothetical protein